jgi:ABC-type lipoprotein release transport system permease subunit
MRITAMCLRNLRHRRLRTILCICGIALAIAFLIGIGAATSRIIAIVKEMNLFFENEIVVVARDVFVIQGFPIGGTLPEKTIDRLMEIEGIEEAVPMFFNLELKSGEIYRMFPANITIGLPLQKIPLIFPSSFLQVKGHFPVDKHKEILVGGSIADQYNLSERATLHLKGNNLTLTGIIRGPSLILSRSIIMSLKLAQEVYNYDKRISMAIVKMESNVDAKKIADEIENNINYVMALTENERNELTSPILDEIAFWNYGTNMFMLTMSAMLIATVEIMNVSESRRDFATLIAIGASKFSIFKIVIAETVLIGFLGGLLGLLFGGAVAVSLASFYTGIPILFFIQSFFELVSPYLALTTLALTLMVCCLSGVIPALFALRINVNEVLRSEY